MPLTQQRPPPANLLRFLHYDPHSPTLPSTAARTFYVSQSLGSDSNDGRSPATPKQTIAAGEALMRNGIDDTLALLRGDEWSENMVWTKSGRAQNARMKIIGYGASGARPKVKSGVSHAFSIATQVNDLEIRGIHFTAHTYDGSSGAPYGIYVGAKSRNLRIYYCEIENFADGIHIDPPIALGSVVTVPEIEYNVIHDCYADAAAPARGIYLARTNDATIRSNYINRIGEVDPGLEHHGIYIRGGTTYGCGYTQVHGNFISEVAGYGYLTRARRASFADHNVFAKCSMGMGFLGRDPVTPHAGGMFTTEAFYNVITLGRDCGAEPRGWGMVMEHIFDPTEPHNPSLDTAINLILDSGTSTDPHPLIIHPEWPEKNGTGVKAVHFVAGVCWNWRGPFLLNDDDTDATQMVEFHSMIYDSDAAHYIFQHNLNNGHHYCGSWMHLDSGASAGQQYRYNGQNFSQSQWIAQLSHPHVGIDKVIPTFLDSTRTLAGYGTVVGGTGTFDDLVALCLAQTEQNWRPELEPEVIAQWLRDGFDLP